jgi:cytidine deaminase
MVTLDPEDAKLLTLARAARARTGAPAGAAVRDDTGRTYAAATVRLPSLQLGALAAAVAAAVASGARGLEAAAVVSAEGPAGGEPGEPAPAELAAVGELAHAEVPVFVAGPDGQVRTVVTAVAR